MDTVTLDIIVKLGELLISFGVLPIIVGLWRLNNNISNLNITLYREFVTKIELNEVINRGGFRREKEPN